MSQSRTEMRVERLPFTVYDIIGYLVPGAFALWAVFVFAKKINGKFSLSSGALDIVGSAPAGTYFSVLIFLIAAYALGHLVGLTSSITVEKLAIEYFGYPSKFLTLTDENDCISIINTNLEGKSLQRFRVLIIKFVCWPLWISIWLLILTKLHSIFMKPFNRKIIDDLSNKIINLNLESGPFKKCEWWKGAEFYVINNIPHAFSRMYNYLTIFGFYRNFCLIFVLLSWVYMGKFLLSTYDKLFGVIYVEHVQIKFNLDLFMSWGWSWLIAAAVCGAIASLFFLGFLKFYRRYSEETILALCYFEMAQKS